MNTKAPFQKDESLYIYVLVRADLPLQHHAPQAIHAAMKASQTFPLLGEERLVFLAVPNKASLLQTKSMLDIHGIPYEEFHEPDYNHGLTSLCTSPIPCCSLFKKMKLWQPVSYENSNPPLAHHVF